MKSLNQKKKELFELLVQYYDLKPELDWCTGGYHNGYGAHCAIGHLLIDFERPEVVATFRLITKNVIAVNDKINSRYQQPTPKQRVIAYLNDEIKKL